MKLKVFVYLIILFFFQNYAFAHDSHHYSIKERTQKSDIVFEGEVLNSSSFWTENKNLIYTKHRVRIDKIFKGHSSTSIINIYTEGGKVEDNFFMNTYAAFLSEGYKGIFFGIAEPYSKMISREFDGFRLLYEKSGYIEYTDNQVGIKAVDNYHNYFKQFETLYDSIYVTTRKHYRTENHFASFLKKTPPCPINPVPVIEFSYDNIELTGLGEYIEFDIMAKAEQAGAILGNSELIITYPTEVFGTDVILNELIEIEKEDIIQSTNYSISSIDLNSDKFKIEVVNAGQSPDSYQMTTTKEKFCHIKFKIGDITKLGEIKDGDFTTTGQASYFCGKGQQYPFDVKIEQLIKVVFPPNPQLATSLTYTFENVQLLGQVGEFLSIDIYVSSATPTYFSGGKIEVIFNDAALELSGVSGFSFQKGEVVLNDDVYVGTTLSTSGTNTAIVNVFAAEEFNLYLLDNEPRRFGSIVLAVKDCGLPIGLEFIESNMQGDSDHYVGGVTTWEAYDPIIADDTDNVTVCGCTDDPEITGFSPTTIIAGTKEVLTITGANFGTYSASSCKIMFPNGDEGGQGFNDVTVEEGDIINWTDTEIKLYVPSATGGAGTVTKPACSGRIEVINACGDDKTGINEILTIPHAVFNRRISPSIPADLLTISNLNGDNGIQFKFASNVPQWAREAFQAALNEWCLVTNISFTISSTDISLPDGAVGGDGFSTISWEDFSGAGLASLVVGTSYFEECLNSETGRTALYMKELDLKISNSNTTPLEVKNVMLHELGHAHMLQHSRDPSISVSNPKDNYLLFFSQTGFSGTDEATIKTEDAAGANLVFDNSFELLEGFGCPDPISFGGCGDITKY